MKKNTFMYVCCTYMGPICAHDTEENVKFGSEYLQYDYLLMDTDWDPEREKTGILMSWQSKRTVLINWYSENRDRASPSMKAGWNNLNRLHI